MLKPSRRLRPGDAIEIVSADGTPSGDVIRLIEREERGTWTASAGEDAQDVLERSGLTPLPPYILRARAERKIEIDDALDRRWYQTVYADAARRGSVAAPTAGLWMPGRRMVRSDLSAPKWPWIQVSAPSCSTRSTVTWVSTSLCYGTALDQARVSPDSKPSTNSGMVKRAS